MQKRRVSPPTKDVHDNTDVVEIVDTQSAISKVVQKMQSSKLSWKPTAVVPPKNLNTQSIAPEPFAPVTPLPEKPNQTEFRKALGELESLALLASAEVKRAQAETKKAEGTLDVVLSEIRSFRNKHDL